MNFVETGLESEIAEYLPRLAGLSQDRRLLSSDIIRTDVDLDLASTDLAIAAGQELGQDLAQRIASGVINRETFEQRQNKVVRKDIDFRIGRAEGFPDHIVTRLERLALKHAARVVSAKELPLAEQMPLF